MNYKSGYTNIKNSAVELKGHLFRTYYYLLSKDYDGKGYMFESQNTIAEALGVCVRTVQRHIKELVRLGYINVARRGFNKTNQYTYLRSVVEKIREKVSKGKGVYTGNNKKRHGMDFVPNRSKEEYDAIEEGLTNWY